MTTTTRRTVAGSAADRTTGPLSGGVNRASIAAPRPAAHTWHKEHTCTSAT
ncbi:hypothetical protein ACFVGY_19840 [Streptomyces sp. NPDC127106]|uniref:hypothetical protein n=1 Tax=Streptomyces sp. NPDC127106 TaxID=3345360 RepID=UPI003643D692